MGKKPKQSKLETRQPFQPRVADWVRLAFGSDILHHSVERNARFLEEALEFVQSTGLTEGQAHDLVTYVFRRPIGDPFQELGGTMVTLAAAAECHQLNMFVAAEKELARVNQPEVLAKVRAKNAAKRADSVLPGAPPGHFGDEFDREPQP